MIKKNIKSLIKRARRIVTKKKWYNLRSLTPVSRKFGTDRGTAIDRVYIEDFLKSNKSCVSGSVLEIAESTYSKKFGENVEKYEVLHYSNDNPRATIIGDLSNTESLPENRIDCFICTQTFNVIYDYRKAIKGTYYLLKKGGVALCTVSGISQITRYDMDRWGDYWRFTSKAIKMDFEQIFGEGNVEITTYGNVLTCTSLIQGICAEELTKEELMYKDDDYQIVIGIKAIKR